MESKTWPGTAELALLHLIGTLWPTSDMNHNVVSPARLLMGEYLGLGRIRSLSDLSSGMFLCTLFLQYEELSKRFIPEVINFLVNAVLHLGIHGFQDAASLPGSFPSPDLNSPLCHPLHINEKKGRSLEPQRPNLVNLLIKPDENTEQNKVDLLGIAFDLLGRFADMYKSLEGFIELFQPILDVLGGQRHKKMSVGLQVRLNVLKSRNNH